MGDAILNSRACYGASIDESISKKCEVSVYLADLGILNSGAIEKLELTFEPNADGSQQPIVLVGANGSGKTTVLSVVTDAIYELAAAHYEDVALPTPKGGHQYFRVLSGRNILRGSGYEIAALRFRQDDKEILYRSKTGRVQSDALNGFLARFPGTENFPAEGNSKEVFGNDTWVPDELRANAYVFFPAGRAESPHWSNSALVEIDPPISFYGKFSNRLNKDVTRYTSIQSIKPWVAGLINDISIDAVLIAQAVSLDSLKTQAVAALSQFPIWLGLNKIVSTILGIPTARIVKTNRGFNEGRIGIADGQTVIIPSLDNLSSGQSALLSIFGTILMYSDGNVGRSLDNISGIVIIDEIDSHLHTDMQYEILPKLIKLFPKIQFIATSHSPLFPLGMEREFGVDGYTLIEMPNGNDISAERYSEFLKSFEHLQKTKKFEEETRAALESVARPSVVCEGETDPKYLRVAAELLGFEELLNRVNFDWIGQIAKGGAKGGGKDALGAAVRIFANKPSLLRSRMLFLFDLDAARPDFDRDNLIVRTIVKNERNKLRVNGIENLLPVSVFEDRFFEILKTKTGDDEITVRKLNKRELCDHLCDDVRNPKIFRGFRPTLEMLAKSLLE
jgi:predicted ATPase